MRVLCGKSCTPHVLLCRGPYNVDDVMNRIESEKKTVGLMVRLYCRRFEGNKKLCLECSELLTYAEESLDRCKFGNEKPTCKKCPVHCYKPEMRERVRKVMRWSGPRMMLYHPLAAIRHMIQEKLK